MFAKFKYIYIRVLISLSAILNIRNNNHYDVSMCTKLNKIT